MKWAVAFADELDREFERLPENVQDAMLATARLLAAYGPTLGRPHVDTLKGSKHGNMKELRFDAGGVWRVAFAFDPTRRAVLLVAGDKGGLSAGRQKKFYRDLVRIADRRYDRHLAAMRKN